MAARRKVHKKTKTNRFLAETLADVWITTMTKTMQKMTSHFEIYMN